MTSQPGVWRPVGGELTKKISGPKEITALSLKSGSGAAVVAIYDAADVTGATPSNLKWLLDCGSAGNDNQTFQSALIFKKGVFAVVEQGDNFSPVLCYAGREYAAS